MASITLNVEGMSCGGCEKSISNALLAKNGVSNVAASHSEGTVAIDYDGSQIQADALAAAIEAAGFDVAA
ncbi:MAG: cation transporter [Gammaproteobacteria bacterium]|nr:cation transporter [Gammaproteobacteria bacterium]